MENIAVFYGGKSVENEVSVITALQVMDNIDKEKYRVVPVYIDHNGVWWSIKDFFKKSAYKNLDYSKKSKIFVEFGKRSLFLKNITKKEIKIDAVVNCCHGAEGENGSLQGLFELLDLPYSSASVLASSVCMNKIVMKQLFERHNFPLTNWNYFCKGQSIDFKEIEQKLRYPLFVKPANLGSSVGISRCENLEQLKIAIEIAFGFDEYVLVEEGVENLMEINCSVQIIDEKVETSELETPKQVKQLLSYEDKYVSKKKGESKTILSPKLSKELKKQVESLSVEAYKKFFLDGVIRIDFLYDKLNKNLFINEINTIPGSMSFYLWKGKGITFKSHITNLIKQAQNKHQKKQEIITKIKSPLLDD